MSEVRFDVDASAVIARLQSLPEDIQGAIDAAFRQLVGAIYGKVIDNIRAMDSVESGLTQHPYRKPGNLADSILGTVRREGDIYIGEISADQEHAPYARILEEGGVISAHRIMPRSAAQLAIPVASFKAFQESAETTSHDFVLTTGVNHPGARIVAYHYMLSALADAARVLNNDIEGAIASIIARSA